MILKLHQINPGHTLIFNTSKKFTNNMYETIDNKKSQYHIKEIFKEGTSSFNQNLLDMLRILDHELILATIGGSFSEGVEIKHPVSGRSRITLIILIL